MVWKKLVAKVKSKWQAAGKFPKIILIVVVGFFILAKLLTPQTQSPKQNPQESKFTQRIDGWGKVALPQQSSFFNLTTVEARQYGVLPNEEFVLKSTQPIDKTFIQDNLTSSTPISITQKDSKSFKIKPKNQLDLNQVINFQLNVGGQIQADRTFDRDYSWAFQTQTSFQVVSTIPRNKAKNVPQNTGISITLSQDNYQNPKKFISISPSVNFRIEQHQETIAIVPQDRLDPRTVYTVTLKKGFNVNSRNDPFDQDYQFSFQTEAEKGEKPYFSLDEDFQQIATNQKFQAKVYTHNWDNSFKIKTEVFRFKTADDFVRKRQEVDKLKNNWIRYYSSDHEVDTSNADKVQQADLNILKTEEVEFIQLPDPLSAGYYLVKYYYKDHLQQVWLQSTDLTGYVSVGKEDTIVWANKTDATPADSTQVSLFNQPKLAETDDTGTAILTTPTGFYNDQPQYLHLKSPESQLLLKINSQQNRKKPGQLTKEDFWSYVYHERELYKPNDTFKFFGVIKNRANNSPPSELTVNLHRGYHYSTSEPDQNPINSQQVYPNSNGAINGQFEFKDLPEGSYNITLEYQNVEIDYDNFSIKNYQKPEIKIKVKTDKKAIFYDQSTTVTAKATFFDNTPLVKTPLKVHERKKSRTDKITTDSNGEINYKYEPAQEERNYTDYISVKPATAQEADQESFNRLKVFHSRVMFDSETNQDNNRVKINATVNQVDLTGLNQETTEQYKGKPVPNQEVNILVEKNWYEKVETGTYYDFIEKTTRKTYDYKYKSENIVNKKIKTDKDGKLKYDLEMEPGKSYQVYLKTKDKNNHESVDTLYFYSPTFRRKEGQKFPRLELGKEESTYSFGEQVNAKVTFNNELYPDNDPTKYLFITAQDGRQTPTIKTEPKYSFDFEKKHQPNIYLAAVVFNGSSYIRSAASCHADWYCRYNLDNDNYFNGLKISYQPEDSKIDLTIQPEQKQYHPGDKAKIKVQATYQDQPVRNATVNLALVDQALKAIGGVVEPDPLNSIYETTQHYIYYNYGSHQPILKDVPQSEMGGGGGSRELLKDTGFWGQAQTNEDGIAEFEFDLPDNITTWIIYTQAIDTNLNTGWTESPLVVTKDFFVTSQFPAEYLTSDQPLLTASAYGKSLSENDQINFETVFSQNEKTLNQSTKTASAFKSVYFDFPNLDPGRYFADVRGQTNNKQDGLKLPFKVINSRTSLETYFKTVLQAGDSQTGIQAKGQVDPDKPIKIVISDQGKGKYYRYLVSSYCTNSNRLEKRLAGITASELLTEKFNVRCDQAFKDIDKFQTLDGGLSLVNWGGTDLKISAWATYLQPELFDQDKLVDYFNNRANPLTQTTENQILAAWGLTELGQSQINRLQQLENQTDVFQEEIHLGLAYVSAGKIEKARDIFHQIIADYAYQSDPYIKIVSPGEDPETKSIIATSYTLLLGQLTDPTYNEKMHNYIRDFHSQADNLVIDLAEISYVQNEINDLPNQNTRYYFKSSRLESTENLTKGKSAVYDLSSQDLDSFYLEILKGQAEAYLTFYLSQSQFDDSQTNQDLTLTRAIEKVRGSPGKKIRLGDLVKVKLNYDLNTNSTPPGRYKVTDYLPSGLKYINHPYLLGLDYEGTTHENQQVVTHYFYNSSWWQSQGRKYVVYYARAGSAGTFSAEPAVIQSEDNLQIFNTTGTDQVKIETTND
jgi:hypothetical protein